MLIFFSLLNNEDIPLDLVLYIFEKLGFSEKEIQRSLSTLINYNFIQVTHNSQSKKTYFSIHEIIQDSIMYLVENSKINTISSVIKDYFKDLLYNNRNQMILFSTDNPLLMNHILKYINTHNEQNEPDENVLSIQIILLDYWVYVKRNHAQALLLIDIIEKNLKRIKNPLMKARFLSTAGDVLSLQRAETPQTKGIFEQMKSELNQDILTLSKVDHFEIIRLQNSIGQNLLLQSKPDEANPYIHNSLKMMASIKEPIVQIPTLYFAAWLYIELGQFEKALECLNKSINMFHQTPSTAIKFYTLNFKAFSLLNLKCYEDAFKTANQSISICKSYFGSQPSDVLGEALNYKAEAALHLGNLPLALKTIESALITFYAFYKGDDKMIDQAYAWLIKGDCFLKQEQFKDAQRAYVNASRIIKTLNASKHSRFYKRLLKRLIYCSLKNNFHSIGKKYIKIYNDLFTKDMLYEFYFINKSVDEFFEM